MLILAHRGASGDAPENTLEAFEEAVRQKADGVELDAMLCGSGEVVVCHDENLRRLAGLDWVVQNTPWSELKGVDVGSKQGRGPARIPLLAQVLGELPKDKLVNVELKCETLDDGGLTARVWEVVQQTQSEPRVLFSSFNALCLRRLRALAPQARWGYLIDPDRSWLLHGVLLARWASRSSIHPDKSACSPARVSGWHRRGLKVAAWTVDDAEEAATLKAWGVDYLITNRPGALRAALF